MQQLTAQEQKEITLVEVLNEMANPKTGFSNVTYVGPMPKGVSSVDSSWDLSLYVTFEDSVDLELLKEISNKKGYKADSFDNRRLEAREKYDQKGNVTSPESVRPYSSFMVLQKWKRISPLVSPLTRVDSLESSRAYVKLSWWSNTFLRGLDQKSVELLEEYRKAKYQMQ